MTPSKQMKEETWERDLEDYKIAAGVIDVVIAKRIFNNALHSQAEEVKKLTPPDNEHSCEWKSALKDILSTLTKTK